MIIDIINELNESNSTNHKLAVLKRHKDNELLQRVLKMAYDKAAFTYGITLKHWHETGFPETVSASMDLENALDDLENIFHGRQKTGNDAIEHATHIMQSLIYEDQEVFKRIIDRDLKINIGRTQINKVWKDLIIKPAYMRCSLFNKKVASKIKFPAILQLKADGTYREVLVEDGKVTYHSRSGEVYDDYPVLTEELSKLPDGYYFGELTVKNGDGSTMPRAEGNGLINSDNPPHDRIYFDMWDMVSVEEYQLAKLKDKKNKPTTPYIKRFETLSAEIAYVQSQMIGGNQSHVHVIESHVVHSVKEAMEIVCKWMNEGLEGGVLKIMEGVFKDGTSSEQWKMKLDIDLEVRVTGFKEGKPGTKREKTFGAMTFKTDDDKIQGACSGFSDKMLEEINSNREAWVGKIITVRCNDITKGRDNDYYALSHPRFIEERDDKNTTDTLESTFKAKEMAMAFEE